MATPLLHVDGLAKQLHAAACCSRRSTFSLAADFTVDGPGVVGVMGPNGSGKTTLFELITGSNTPTRGPRAGRRPGHPRGALRRARPARDPLPPVLPGALASGAPGPRLHDGARAQRRRRWSTCSTSRSSTRRTATSASCSTSSGACAARAGSCSSACTRTSRSTSRSCARACERFVFVERGRLTHAPRRRAAADARARLPRPPRRDRLTAGPTGPAPPSRREGSEAGREQPCSACA